MTRLIVIGLAPETIAKLQIQAQQHGRSLDEEVKIILELATRSVNIDENNADADLVLAMISNTTVVISSIDRNAHTETHLPLW